LSLGPAAVGHLMSAVDILVSVSRREPVLLIEVERPTVLMEYNNSSLSSSVTRQSKKEGEESLRVNRGALGMSEWRSFVTTEEKRELVHAGWDWAFECLMNPSFATVSRGGAATFVLWVRDPAEAISMRASRLGGGI
jgi:hypothetical protein